MMNLHAGKKQKSTQVNLIIELIANKGPNLWPFLLGSYFVLDYRVQSTKNSGCWSVERSAWHTVIKRVVHEYSKVKEIRYF